MCTFIWEGAQSLETYFENQKSEKKEPGGWCGEHVCEVSSKSEHGKGV